MNFDILKSWWFVLVLIAAGGGWVARAEVSHGKVTKLEQVMIQQHNLFIEFKDEQERIEREREKDERIRELERMLNERDR